MGSPQLGQQKEYLLHSGQYASCVRETCKYQILIDHHSEFCQIPVIVTAHIRRMEKLMFSVCPHLGGVPQPCQDGGTLVRSG